MLAGTLRHSITIESPVETPDGSGGSVSAWITLCTTRASVTPLSGRELVQAQSVQSDTSHRVVMRYRSGITAQCRILLGPRVFRITAPPRDMEERHRSLEIDCTEVIGEAE